MPEIQYNNKCVLSISPITDQSFHFISFNIKESIFGELPELTLTVKTEKDICKLNDEITGVLINEEGYPTSFNGYVYSISYDGVNNKCVIKILCVKPDFVKKEQTNKFDSMNDAIKFLYPGKIESNAQSDLMNSMVIYQKNMTNYNLLKKCLHGYKENTIFGFAFGDLRLHDLSNWESKLTVGSLADIQPVDIPELTDPKLYHKESEDIDYSDGKDPNHKIIKFYDSYIPVNKEYEHFIKNTLYNQRFLTTKYIANYSTRELFPLNITDWVEVEDSKKQIKECFISSREINFEANKMNVSYTIQSINPI